MLVIDLRGATKIDIARLNCIFAIDFAIAFLHWNDIGRIIGTVHFFPTPTHLQYCGASTFRIKTMKDVLVFASFEVMRICAMPQASELQNSASDSHVGSIHAKPDHLNTAAASA